MVVEHPIARVVQLGIQQSPFGGRTLTGLQLLLAATLANLMLVAGGETFRCVWRAA